MYSKYSDIGYKSADGFDVISVALQSDKMAWEQDLRNFDLLKMNNCISTKGYNDFFVKGFKISQTPASFLIDEFGKIVFINPSIKMIIDYLNGKRNFIVNACTCACLYVRVLPFQYCIPIMLSMQYQQHRKDHFGQDI